MKNYRLSQLAQKDIEEIIDYLEQISLKVVNIFIESTYATFDFLAENPEIGHTREDLTTHTVKFWKLKWHYLVIYKPTKPIKIIRILSSYRNISVLTKSI